MFENIIEFSAHEIYVSLKDEYPIPAKIIYLNGLKN